MMSANRLCADPVEIEYLSSSLGIPSGPLDRPFLRLLAAAPISSDVKGLASGHWARWSYKRLRRRFITSELMF